MPVTLFRSRDALSPTPALQPYLYDATTPRVRTTPRHFAYVKIAGFLMLETSLAVLVIVALWSVFAGSQRNYDGQPSESRGEDP